MEHLTEFQEKMIKVSFKCFLTIKQCIYIDEELFHSSASYFTAQQGNLLYIKNDLFVEPTTLFFISQILYFQTGNTCTTENDRFVLSTLTALDHSKRIFCYKPVCFGLESRILYICIKRK